MVKNNKTCFINDDSLVISVPNEFTKDWVQGRYADLITSALQEVVGNENFRVHFVTPPVNEDEQTIFTQEETVTYRRVLLIRYHIHSMAKPHIHLIRL